jgi:hypothetical protein
MPSSLLATTNGDEDPSFCQDWFLVETRDVSAVGHRDVGEYGFWACREGVFEIDIRANCPAGTDEAWVAERKQMAAIGADKCNPSGHGCRAERKIAGGAALEILLRDRRDPLNSALFGLGACIERMQVRIADRHIVMNQSLTTGHDDNKIIPNRARLPITVAAMFGIPG